MRITRRRYSSNTATICTVSVSEATRSCRARNIYVNYVLGRTLMTYEDAQRFSSCGCLSASIFFQYALPYHLLRMRERVCLFVSCTAPSFLGHWVVSMCLMHDVTPIVFQRSYCSSRCVVCNVQRPWCLIIFHVWFQKSACIEKDSHFRLAGGFIRCEYIVLHRWPAIGSLTTQLHMRMAFNGTS